MIVIANWKQKVLFLFMMFVVLGGVIGYIKYSDKREEERLKNDTQNLYEIAGKLGYTSEDYLNFHWSYASGIDASYDTVSLLFITEKPREEFSQLVRNLEFEERNSFSYEDIFSDASDELKKGLWLGSESGGGNMKANITYWDLFDKSVSKQVSIRYADGIDDNNLWKYNGKQFPFAVIELNLNRQ